MLAVSNMTDDTTTHVHDIKTDEHLLGGFQGLQAYANPHINMRKSTPICEKSEKYAK